MTTRKKSLVSRSTAARLLGIHPRTLDRWRKEKLYLPFYQIGETVKYDPDEVELLKRHRRVAVHGFPTEEK